MDSQDETRKISEARTTNFLTRSLHHSIPTDTCLSTMTEREGDANDDSTIYTCQSFKQNTAMKNGAVVVAAASRLLQRNRRRIRYKPRPRWRVRLCVEQQIAHALQENMFEVEFRMSEPSFRKLTAFLKQHMKPEKLRQRGDSVDVVTKVAVALRWFGGASYIDLMRRFGLSKSTVFKCVNEVIDAINRSKDIGYMKWPKTVEECQQLAAGFSERSGIYNNRHLITNAVGMIDGLFIRTKLPSKKETKNVEAFRSGHKKAIGLNAQCVCDSQLRFLWCSVRTPGKTNDLKAYHASKVSELIESLPPGFFVGGDNAYQNSEHLIVPIPGGNLNEKEDAFNFFFSQLRVRIENAFALLVNKWGILWKPLRVALSRQPALFLCLCKLHNYCIDQKEKKLGHVTIDGTSIPSHASHYLFSLLRSRLVCPYVLRFLHQFWTHCQSKTG